jgi:hypothetical protein
MFGCGAIEGKMAEPDTKCGTKPERRECEQPSLPVGIEDDGRSLDSAVADDATFEAVSVRIGQNLGKMLT